MPTARTNFRRWYARVLRPLYVNRDAGIAIAHVAFPLLERYLRQKVGLKSTKPVDERFYDALMVIYPALGTRDNARIFWTIFRHGLLHEATLAIQSRSSPRLPAAGLSHDVPAVAIDSAGSYWLNPVKFTEVLLKTIERDFAIFESGKKTAAPLPQVKSEVFTPAGAIAPGFTVLTTKGS